MSRKTINLSENLYDYLLIHSIRKNQLLDELRNETAKLPDAGMQISPEQGQFMALMVRIMGAKSILELGTYTGYSSLVMAMALPQEGRILTCDINPETTAIARNYWEKAGVMDKIELILKPALELVSELTEQFDIVFLDADKQNYPHYYTWAIEHLRSGGLLMVDNVLWGGRVADPSDQQSSTVAIRSTLDMALTDNRVDISLLPLGDGLLIARKR